MTLDLPPEITPQSQKRRDFERSTMPGTAAHSGGVIDRYIAEVLPLKRSAQTRSDQARQWGELKKTFSDMLADNITAQQCYRYHDLRGGAAGNRSRPPLGKGFHSCATSLRRRSARASSRSGNGSWRRTQLVGSSNKRVECPEPLKGSQAKIILVRPERLLAADAARPPLRSGPPSRCARRRPTWPQTAKLSNSLGPSALGVRIKMPNVTCP